MIRRVPRPLVKKLHAQRIMTIINKSYAITAEIEVPSHADWVIYGSSFGNGLSFRAAAAGTLNITKASVASYGNSSGTLTANTRQHVALTYDGATFRFYVQGLAAGTQSVASATFAHAVQYEVATDAAVITPPNGVVFYHLRTWGRPLSAAEIFAEATDRWGIYRDQRAAWRKPAWARAIAVAAAADGGGFTTDGVPKGFNPGRGPTRAQFWQTPLSIAAQPPVDTPISAQAESAAIATAVMGTGKPAAASSAAVADLVRQTGKIATASTTPTKLLNLAVAAIRLASSTPTKSLTLSTTKTAIASSAAVAALVLSTGKPLSASSAAVASLSAVRVTLLSALAASVAVASLVRDIAKPLAATSAAIAAAARVTAKTAQAASAAIADLVKDRPVSAAASSATIASLARQAEKPLAAVSAAAASAARSSRSPTAACSTTAAISTSSSNTRKPNPATFSCRSASPTAAPMQRRCTCCRRCGSAIPGTGSAIATSPKSR